MQVRRRLLPILVGVFLAVSLGLTFLGIRSYWRFDFIEFFSKQMSLENALADQAGRSDLEQGCFAVST